MSMEEGLPNSKLLGWATVALRETGEFESVEYDAGFERVLLTARSGQRLQLFIERGRPVVELIDGPAPDAQKTSGSFS